ncbi:hypothetical protein MNBD_GAMMA09-1407, partial [hydrothermal vent metagenome]
WRIKAFNGLDWVGYFISKVRLKGGGKIIWSIPLTKEHFLSFQFDDPGYPSEKLVKAFNQLAEQIVASCTIEYSEAVQQQIKQAAKEGPGEPYSSHREPQAWEEYDLEPERFKRKSSC